ncbi:MAG: hypothetical protein Q8O30_06815 [Candidatus Omnitrophota bacterium]|nr:hypothetical protein [Candidatus Omnitrophota bacterium]
MYKIINKLIIALIIIILLYFAANYLLNFFLPQKIKAAAEKFADENLNNKIEINQIKINILRGISFNGVSIYHKDEKIPYAKISKIRAVPFYTALLTQKKLIFSLKIDGGTLNLERKENGEIKLPQIKTAAPKEPSALAQKEEIANPAPVTAKKSAHKEPLFFIKDITVRQLNFDFEDKLFNFRKKFTNIFAYADLKTFPEIKFMLSWEDKASLKGSYFIDVNQLKASCLLQKITLADFNPYFKDFSFENGSIKKAQLVVDGKDVYLIKGNAKIQDAIVSYTIGNLKSKCDGDAVKLRGNLNLDTELKIEGNNFTCHIGGSLLQGEINDIPTINTLNNINANFSLDNSKFECSYIAADFPIATTTGAIHLQAKGELDLNSLQFYCEVMTGSLISQFIAAGKTIKQFSFDYNEKGDITLNAILKGNLRQNTFDYYLDYQIKNAQFKELSNIYADGFLKKDKLVLTKCSLVYKNIPVKLKGDLENFSLPAITLNAESDLLSVDLKSKYNKDTIDIENLILKIADSKVASQGTITIKEKPLATLQGIGYIDLKDIKTVLKLFNLKYPLLEKIGPEGVLTGKFTINGGQNLAEWEIKFAGLSDKIKVCGITAKEIKIELYRDKNELIVSPLLASIADGKAELRIKMDYLNDKAILNILINDLDLAELKKDLKLKDTNLAGILSLETSLENDSLSQWNKLNGGGKISIKEGNIWEINFLKGLGQFLFIPEFNTIVFEEGYSDLIFKGENVVFENIELKSYKMALRGKGRISLKGDMNFILISEFNPNLVSSSESLKKTITNILGKNSLAIELDGTLQKPNYKIKPVFFSNLEGVKNLLEEILK